MILRFVFFCVFFFSSSCFAALPFVTDDASIAEPNQLSLETFVENWRLPSKQDQDSGNLIGTYLGGSYGVAKNLEMTVGGLAGYNFRGDKFNIGNPIFQAKTMAFSSKKDLRIPSIAISAGYVNRYGRDQYFDSATNGYLLGIATSKFFDGDFIVHLNVGAKSSYNISGQKNYSRMHLGIAIDQALSNNLRVIAESYNGTPNSPRDSAGYFHSYQIGFRFLKSSTTSFHILYGSQPTFAGYDENNRMFYRNTSWVQFGMRKIIDDLF